MMSKTYTIRKEVFNADIKQWEKIRSLCSGTDGMTVTPQQFHSYVGFCGALTTKCSNHELDFFREVNSLERLNNENLKG